MIFQCEVVSIVITICCLNCRLPAQKPASKVKVAAVFGDSDDENSGKCLAMSI